MKVTKTIKVSLTTDDIRQLIVDALFEQYDVVIEPSAIKFDVQESSDDGRDYTPAALLGAKVEVNE